MPGKLAYIMSRFPHLPETFILREMIAIEGLGWQVSLYPLVVQSQGVIHEEAKSWVEKAHRLPWISAKVLAANWKHLLGRPGRYLSTLWQTLTGNFSSPKFLLRALAIFPKAALMADMMQQEGIQHIHAHYATHPALAAWIIHSLTGISYSVTVHAHDIFVEKPMLAAKLQSAAFVSAISNYNVEYLTPICGDWIHTKARIVRCGIDPAYYKPHVSAPMLEQGLKILCTGSLQEYKGQTYLIQACKILADRQIPFHCQIIGGGELFNTLNAEIEQLGLRGQVALLGPKTQTEIAGLLTQANCYIQPSIITKTGKMEGIPVSLMEAMACGLPVIATRLSGIPELVRPGETGLLVPPNNPQALADALEQYYRNPAAARSLAQAGREWVLLEFNLDINVQRLNKLFADTIQA